ncbi:hypothetical protein EPUS_06834 [Endocarpon pusillum Z07020]|uniref:SWIM-type domain-containing protein n=1 Tax=Endocarpon pusillum (strain Z07020 / HMAS-L-300199) TaxID=1263415 RepID=U1G2E5_ENDPU|nr:uncharacterized protein EPUS_06834 [Endocarpon pusillum Z07020]ERF71452.1 hypothetical protein EPUS_06834 [Endocarpon pusillum Z07020]
MPLASRSPESFITSLVDKISLLVPPLPSTPSSSSPSASRPRPLDSNVSTDPVSPPSPPNFSTLLSTLPKEDQESVTRLLMTLHFFFPHEFIPALDLLDRGLVTRLVIGSLPSPTNVSEASHRKPHVDYQAPWNEPTGDLDPPLNTYMVSVGPYLHETDLGIHVDFEAGRQIATENEVFYVQSASSQTKTTRQRRHHHTSVSSTNYEVRLGAWNCTCPAFALSTFSRLMDPKADGRADDNREPLKNLLAGDDHHNVDFYDSAMSQTEFEWRFGGTFTRTISDPEHGIDSERKGASVPVPVCKHILAALLGKHIPGLFGSGVQLRTVSAEEGAGWAGGWGDGD